jgi:hypothetical protein
LNNNTLLRIFLDEVTPWMNPVLDLSVIRNLASDFWVMNRAWIDLSSLSCLPSVHNFSIVMTSQSSPLANHPSSAMATRPLSLDNLYDMGFQLQGIETAVTRYRGVSPADPWFPSQVDGIENLVTTFIPGGLVSLHQMDPTWQMPAFDSIVLKSK